MAEFGISYFGNRDPKHVKKDLQELKKIGFGTIVHTFSENDNKFYKQTMKEIIKISKDLGFEVWIDPWGYGGIFGGEAFSGFLQDNPLETQVTNKGERVGAVCFNSEKFNKFMKEWIDSVQEIGGETIFWDEPHYKILQPFGRFPEEYTCRCKKCQNSFFEKYGYEMPEKFNKDISDFRNNVAVEFFTEMTEYASEKGLKNNLCFLPQESEEIGIKDYEKISSLETITNIGSDPYWYGYGKPVEEFVGNTADKIKKLQKKYNKESHIWIQSFKVPKDRENEIKKAAEILKVKKIDKIMFWGIKGCEVISSISSDNPEKVWKNIIDIVKAFEEE